MCGWKGLPLLDLVGEGSMASGVLGRLSLPDYAVKWLAEYE
jgi:hypothetical protein